MCLSVEFGVFCMSVGVLLCVCRVSVGVSVGVCPCVAVADCCYLQLCYLCVLLVCAFVSYVVLCVPACSHPI